MHGLGPQPADHPRLSPMSRHDAQLAALAVVLAEGALADGALIRVPDTIAKLGRAMDVPGGRLDDLDRKQDR